ncbi:MAG: helix-turn-helix domain-containing protein [Acidocella sp.]|uniref:helix-turn-helix domain-containing protein n=1 Tax=Acidocella sp. KAb 2-4 TaxID=2885158 RepID=UPI001D09345C|nr:helix-turn-helix domain-containing protein [Acidocella sp. KAb 2-4]MCB5943730.1 helix-turn-helix domain-containing protein [Acidocella sp. KAb 2-4]MDR3505129.1 helix-turn-helix domain-containing protein [Acidocella sp.]
MAKHMTTTAETGDSTANTTTTEIVEFPTPTKLLTANEVGELLGVPPEALERWRGNGSGLPFIRLSGRYIRYRPEDLADFIQSSRRNSTAG